MLNKNRKLLKQKAGLYVITWFSRKLAKKFGQRTM